MQDSTAIKFSKHTYLYSRTQQKGTNICCNVGYRLFKAYPWMSIIHIYPHFFKSRQLIG
jgi:hypothetical protein